MKKKVEEAYLSMTVSLIATAFPLTSAHFSNPSPLGEQMAALIRRAIAAPSSAFVYLRLTSTLGIF